MANILWCESPAPSDCLADGEWDKMIEYIKHSAVVDFTIYGTEATCTDTGQAFLFSQTGILSEMYGGADAGDDMIIYANDSDLCSLIKLFGGGGITNKIAWDSSFQVTTCSDEALLVVSPTTFTYKGTEICLAPCGGSSACPAKGDLPFTLWNDCTAEDEKGFQFSISGAVSTFAGSDDTGDDLILKANSTNAYPFIELFGDEGIELQVANEDVIYFKDAGEQDFMFYRDAITSYFKGSDDTGDILKIMANSADARPFILLDGDDFALIDVASYVEFQDQGEQMFKFEHTSPTSYLYGSDDTSDDLIILANEQDDCALISLYGNGGIKCEIKVTSVFEVTTCSDEVLFEVDSSSGDLHVDFHCLDAHNFVLENRTDDPGSPCVGQLWFRSDLV